MRKTLAILLLLFIAAKGYCASASRTNVTSPYTPSAISVQDDVTIDFNLVADDDLQTIFDDKDDDDNDDFTEQSFITLHFQLVSLQPFDTYDQHHPDFLPSLITSGADILVKHQVFRI